MPKTCLIVDDSTVIRTMIARALKLSGAGFETILEASNGTEALAILQSVKVQLVLSDLHMPEMGGAELISRMQEEGLAHIPVVIVSAEPSTRKMQELCILGARAYLQKPFTPEGIGALVSKLTEGQREED